MNEKIAQLSPVVAKNSSCRQLSLGSSPSCRQMSLARMYTNTIFASSYFGDENTASRAQATTGDNSGWSREQACSVNWRAA